MLTIKTFKAAYYDTYRHIQTNESYLQNFQQNEDVYNNVVD